MKKLLSILCLLALALGMIAVPAVTVEAANETFYAGYGIANITPAYTVRTLKVSTTKEKASAGNADAGTMKVKTIDDPLIYASYGTSDLRMGQNYVPANSYDADGNKVKNTLYFTAVDGTVPKYQFVDGDMFATCIALRYGNGEPLLLVALDMSGVSEDVTKDIRSAICQKAKKSGWDLNPERIMVSASHTHSAPSAANESVANVKWKNEVYYPGAAQAALDSLEDLAAATIQTATVCASREDKVGGEYRISELNSSATGNIMMDSATSYVNFNYDESIDNYDERLQYMSAVRHYKYQTYACTTCGLSYVRTDSSNTFTYNYLEGFSKKNGDPCPAKCGGTVGLVTRYYGDSFWTRAEGICAPTSLQVNVKQAYQDMHLVKFDRAEPKKDIVLMNWRAHPHRVGGESSSILSNDLSGAIRDVLTGLRGEDGVYDKVDLRASDELIDTMDCLVSYYQGASGNINETSHDRVTSFNGGYSNAKNEDAKSYYYDRETGKMTEWYKDNYMDQGAVLADIARDALNTSDWWTAKEAGPINVISTTYGSNATNLDLQVSQLQTLLDGHNGKAPMITWDSIYKSIDAMNGYPLADGSSHAEDPRLSRFYGEDGYKTLYEAGQKEYAVYKYIYDTVEVMRELFAARNGKDSKGVAYYSDVQACRRAVIERDPSHVVNGLYGANKIHNLLADYSENGTFTSNSVTNYKKSSDVLDEEINTVLIGTKLAIVTAPHELFDYTSQQIENLGEKLGISDLKILFFGYSNGSNGYVPYDEAWQYETTAADNNDKYYFSASPYEANTCSYERGAAEGIRDTAYSMLAQLTGANEDPNHCACFNNASTHGSFSYYHNTGHVCDTGEWLSRNGTKESLELEDGKKYQLGSDMSVENLYLSQPTANNPTVSTMICLNGHTLTLGTTVNLSTGQTLAICGCEQSQKGKIVNASGNTDYFFRIGEGELLIFGGALDAENKHRAILFGSSAETPGKLCMFGGSIQNGRTTVAKYSGNVTMNSGQLWLYGGTITGGQSLLKSGNDYNYDDSAMASTIHGAGGNIFVANGVVRQFGSSVVSNGVAGISGGNVFMNGGQYIMSGGTITGGQAVPAQYGYASDRQIIGAGGNVFVAKNSEFTMNGGTISDGVATYAGGNVCSRGELRVNSNKDFYGNDCSGIITGGYAKGTTMTSVVNTLTVPESYRGARGGNIYSTQPLWLYGGKVTNGRAGIEEDGTVNPDGQENYYCGGNIYATSAVSINGTVQGGAAYGRGNNLYFDSGTANCNLADGVFIDDSPYAQAAENVNIHDAKTVKLVGGCVFEGGQYALRILSTPATVYTESTVIESATPDTGVWLDASFDSFTDELLGAPAFNGEVADIVLDQNTKLVVFDNFQRVVDNYYYHNGKGRDGETTVADNRIVVGILEADKKEIISVSDTNMAFARRAVTATKVTEENGETLLTPRYDYNKSKVVLGEIRYCFKATDNNSYVLRDTGSLGGNMPVTPVENEQQWLVFTSKVAEVNGIPCGFNTALTWFKNGKDNKNGDVNENVSAIKLLCSIDTEHLGALTTGIANNVVIDLNGYNLTWKDIASSLTGNATLACIDSTTNDYNCFWEGSTGQEVYTKYGTLYTNDTDVLEAQHVQNSRRYLRIGETAQENVPGYSFHRIYMQINAFGITPARSGITYSAVFLANARVRNVLGVDGYGVKASLWYQGEDVSSTPGGTLKTYGKYLPSPSTGDDKGTYKTQDLNDYAKKTTLIEGILEPNKGWTTEERANTEIRLVPCVVLDGEVLEVGAEVTRTYKEQIGKANAAWTAGTLTESQKDGLYSMYRKYMDTMQNWDDMYISNMVDRYHDEGSVDKELDNELDGDPWA